MFSESLSPTKIKNLAYGFSAGLLLFLSKAGSAVKEGIANFVSVVTEPVRKLLFKTMDASNYNQMLDDLGKLLKSKVIGQNKAIDQIIKIMRSHFSNVLKAKKLGVPYNKGLMLYFIGPPGVGKSLILDTINSFLNLTSVTLGIDDVNEDRGNNALTARDRLMKPYTKDYGYMKEEVASNLARVISYEKSTLYTFDELDKMRYWDYNRQGIDWRELRRKGEKLPGSSMDEFLRAFVDTGKLDGKSTNNSVVVITSNETLNDIQDLESSLANRYNDCIVEFEPFNAESCAAFVKKSLEDITGRYYKKVNGAEIVWDEDSLKSYAQFLENLRLNGRSLSALTGHFTPIIDEFYSKNPKVKKMFLHWDKEKGADGVFVSEK